MAKYLAINNEYMKLLIHILRVGNLIDRQVSKVLKKEGITHIQFNVLRNLEATDTGCLYAGELKERLLFEKSDTTRIMDRLVKKLLISRGRCTENRRKVKVTITEKGKKMLQRLMPEIDKAVDGFYKEKITEHEKDIMLNVLRRIK